MCTLLYTLLIFLALSVDIDAKIAYNIYFLMTLYTNVPFVREFTVDSWKVTLWFQNWRLIYSWGLIFFEVLQGGEGYISYIGPDTFLHTSFIINIEFFSMNLYFLKFDENFMFSEDFQNSSVVPFLIHFSITINHQITSYFYIEHSCTWH